MGYSGGDLELLGVTAPAIPAAYGPLRYTAFATMQQNEQSLEGALIRALSDGFNRAIGALESAGAVDTSKMREAYAGVGSEFYDLVSKELERTAEQAAETIRSAARREDV